jgi:hypothetical protein
MGSLEAYMFEKFIQTALLFGVFAGVVILQVFLSKKDDKRFGLILPIIFFIISFIPAVYNTYSLLTMDYDWETGTLYIFNLTYFLAYAYMFLLLNIPTVALIAICIVCKRKRFQQRAIDKMNIQDLK